LFIRRPHPKAY